MYAGKKYKIFMKIPSIIAQNKSQMHRFSTQLKTKSHYNLLFRSQDYIRVSTFNFAWWFHIIMRQA